VHPRLAAALVFCTSAAVLVLEILAGRLLAPYIGVSLETFTGIIGVVLAGIAVGSWAGGVLADRVDPRRLLGPMVGLGGVATLATVPLVTAVGAGMDDPGTYHGHLPQIVTLALVGFFLPAVTLSAVSPTVVRLQLQELDHTGRTVGRLSAFGTAGSLAGTFVTGFLLVGLFPTRATITVLGAVLVATGFVLWFALGHDRDRRRDVGAGVAAALVLGVLSLAATGPCDAESEYFCARVVDVPDDPTGRELVLDNLVHSYVDLDDPTHLELDYAVLLGAVADAVAPAGRPIEALHIGGGGFTIPRYLRATRPGTHSLVLEIDGELVDFVQDELGLELGPDLEVDVGDARLGLHDQPSDSVDLVVGDAFGSRSVPWHLTTREFLDEVDDVLAPGGIYALNMIDGRAQRFAHAEAATLADVFAHVAVLGRPDTLDGVHSGNFVMVASQDPLPLDPVQTSLLTRGEAGFTALTGPRLDEWFGDADVLTDDYAPVDRLISPPG
jgi:spermidine synthase